MVFTLMESSWSKSAPQLLRSMSFISEILIPTNLQRSKYYTPICFTMNFNWEIQLLCELFILICLTSTFFFPLNKLYWISNIQRWLEDGLRYMELEQRKRVSMFKWNQVFLAWHNFSIWSVRHFGYLLRLAGNPLPKTVFRKALPMFI